MTPELWERIKAVFDDLSDSSPEHRLSVLSSLEPEMRSEVEHLLQEYDESRQSSVEHQLGTGSEFLSAILGDFHTFERGDVLKQRFEIIEFLGSGGMGEVYEARDVQMGVVAIKTVRFDLLSNTAVVERFRREVQRARMVSHVNVCRVNEWFDETVEDGTSAPFATMELLRGPTLHAAVRDRGPFPHDEALRIAIPLCHGMAAAHDADVIHRDLKSGNIILATRQDGSVRPVITDFGLARLLSDESITRTSLMGAIAGTRAYLAPELIQGNSATKVSDLYALGVVLFRLVTGQYPFDPEAEWETAVAQRRNPPGVEVLVPSLPEPWRDTVSGCLEFDPQSRPSSALEVAKMLSGAVVPSPGDLLSRRRLIIGLVIASAGGAGAVDFWRKRPPFALSAWNNRQRILIEEFDNPEPGGALGRSVRNLFRLALASSPIRPIRRVEIATAVESLGIGAVPLKGSQGRAVARRTGANLLLGGAIRKADDGYVLLARVTDAESGNQLRQTEQRVQGRLNLPSAVESAAQALQILPLVLAAQIGGTRLEQADTDDPDALEKFTEALQYYQDGETQVAQAYLEEAVRLDRNFAVAYVYQAVIYCAFRRDDLAMSPSARAYELRYKVSPRHRHHAEALFHIVHGDFERAHDSFRILAGLYPQEAQLQRHLAQSYAQFEKGDAVLEHAQRAVELDPANALNQNLYIGALAENGRFQDAAKALVQAKATLPGNSVLQYTAAYVDLLQSRIDSAVESSREAGRSRDMEGLARQLEIKALLLGGRLAEARRQMELEIEVRRVAGDQATVDAYRYWLGQLLSLENDQFSAAQYAAALAQTPQLPANLAVLRHSAELAWRTRSAELLHEVTSKMSKIVQLHQSTRALGMLQYAQGLLAAVRGPATGGDLLARAYAFWPDTTARFAVASAAAVEKSWEQALAGYRQVAASKAWALRSDAVLLWISSLPLAADCATRLGYTDEAAGYMNLYGQHWASKPALAFAGQQRSL